jgi:hypothetical protein
LYRIKILQNMHPVCKKGNTNWILQKMWQSNSLSVLNTKCYISGKSNTTHYWVTLSILAASCYGYACNCNTVICESGSKFREWKHLINKWNKHVTQTDMKQEQKQWRLGKEPKGVTNIGQLIK